MCQKKQAICRNNPDESKNTECGSTGLNVIIIVNKMIFKKKGHKVKMPY